MSGNHNAYQFDKESMRKELIVRLRNPAYTGLVDIAADLIEAQAKEIDRLKWYEEQYLLENTDINELRTEIESLHRRLEEAITLNEPVYKELRAALVECNSALEGAYDYVEDAINEYIAGHGESFRPQRLQYIRDRKADCDTALTRCKEVLK